MSTWEQQSYPREPELRNRQGQVQTQVSTIDLETHADKVSVENGTITMEDGNGWEGDQYWEDVTAEIRDGEIEIMDAVGGRPPRSI